MEALEEAFANYADYQLKKEVDELPPLTEAQTEKLRHLTVVSLAAGRKNIPYRLLHQELHIANIRELEGLLISAIYADVVVGELNPDESIFEVRKVIGRDVNPSELYKLRHKFECFGRNCENVMDNIQQQVDRCNHRKAQHVAAQQALEQKIACTRKTLKGQGLGVTVDGAMSSNYQGEKPKKRMNLGRKGAFGWGYK